ncbi:MAG: glycosyltransferase family 4 protein [Candidatus Aminicenantes bacterium]|nr:glycosyltransferase family 4 protein [Candidatus Aminicenantes bacterium]MDH5714060.1 glycosyltransferase family 4 protein [Candidatus Aminicenantes bacterium]
MSINILHIDIGKGWRESELQLLPLGRALQKRGHRLWIGAPPKTGLLLKSPEYRMKAIPIRGVRFFQPLEAERIANAVKREGIAILHLHGLHSLRYGLWVKRMTRNEVIVVLSLQKVSPSLRKGRRLREGRGVEQIVVSSKLVQKRLESIGIESERLCLIRNGVNLIQFSPSVKPYDLFQEYSFPPEMTIIGYVAPSLCDKGARILIEAASEVASNCSDIIFLIAGEDRGRKGLEALVESYGLSKNFIFSGFPEKLPATLAALDLFVLPAVEGNPELTILNAMATGLSVIATDLSGVKEIIKNGVNGVVVPPGEPHTLARAITQFMEDRRKWRIMGQEGRKLMEAKFDIEKTARTIEKLYKQLLKKGGLQRNA